MVKSSLQAGRELHQAGLIKLRALFFHKTHNEAERVGQVSSEGNGSPYIPSLRLFPSLFTCTFLSEYCTIEQNISEIHHDVNKSLNYSNQTTTRSRREVTLA